MDIDRIGSPSAVGPMASAGRCFDGKLPTFQFTAIIYIVGAVTSFALSGQRPRTPEIPMPRRIVPILMVALGIMVSNVLFLLAVAYMPPAQAT